MSYNFYNQQNTAPYNFPQPSGNVYSINNSLEVANVPTGAGVSVALCMPENLMYIKTVQNGSPMFWTYQITPYDKEPAPAPTSVEDTSKLEEFQDKIKNVEDKLDKIIKELGVKTK